MGKCIFLETSLLIVSKKSFENRSKCGSVLPKYGCYIFSKKSVLLGFTNFMYESRESWILFSVVDLILLKTLVICLFLDFLFFYLFLYLVIDLKTKLANITQKLLLKRTQNQGKLAQIKPQNNTFST